MIFISALGLFSIAFIRLLFYPISGLLMFLAIKPIIDATWDNGFAGTNLLQVTAVIVPVLMFIHMWRSSYFHKMKFPLTKVATLFLLSNILTAVMMIFSYEDIIKPLNFLFRGINLYLALFLIPFIVRDVKGFKRLLQALLIAGLFPMAIGVYQLATGQVLTERIAVTNGVQRYIGVYHDAVSIRTYGYMTITAIILYASYFGTRRKMMKYLLIIYFLICALVIFRVYSKAAVVTAISWIILWAIYTKNWRFYLALPVIGITAFIVAGDAITNDILQLFGKEIAIRQGDLDSRYALAGRSTIWEVRWGEWMDGDPINKTFGLWKMIPAHNDLLLALYVNGIVGLIAYVAFIVVAGWRVFKKSLRLNTPLNIMALMLFTMWCIDMIGLTPSVYPAYAWFVWGIIALSFKQILGLDNQLSLQRKRKAKRQSFRNKKTLGT